VETEDAAATSSVRFSVAEPPYAKVTGSNLAAVGVEALKVNPGLLGHGVYVSAGSK
jgi:hypothetical protein